jgi:hypothetical protein
MMRTLIFSKATSMALWDFLRSLLGDPPPPEELRQLDGRSEPLLKASMNILQYGERGWISMKAASHLFSKMDQSYAFGETDDAGKYNIASFATKTGCEVQFMPVEQRVYFVRRNR